MRSIYFLANVILLISTTFAFQSILIQFKAVVSTSKPLQLKCAANHRCSRMMKFPGHSNIRFAVAKLSAHQLDEVKATHNKPKTFFGKILEFFKSMFSFLSPQKDQNKQKVASTDIQSDNEDAKQSQVDSVSPPKEYTRPHRPTILRQSIYPEQQQEEEHITTASNNNHVESPPSVAIDTTAPSKVLHDNPIVDDTKLTQARRYAALKLKEIEDNEKKQIIASAAASSFPVSSTVLLHPVKTLSDDEKQQDSSNNTISHHQEENKQQHNMMIAKKSLLSLTTADLQDKWVLLRYDLHVPRHHHHNRHHVDHNNDTIVITTNNHKNTTACASCCYPSISSLIHDNNNTTSNLFQDLLPSLTYLLSHHAKVMLLTSYGPARLLAGQFQANYSLAALSPLLEQQLKQLEKTEVVEAEAVKVHFVSDSIGLARTALQHQLDIPSKQQPSTKPGKEVMLLENTIFHNEEQGSSGGGDEKGLQSYLKALVKEVDWYVQDGIHSLYHHHNKASSSSSMSEVTAEYVTSVAGVKLQEYIEAYNHQIQQQPQSSATNDEVKVTIPSHQEEGIVINPTLPVIANLANDNK